MLRILQVAAPTTAGGLERVVESLAIGHHDLGHDVTVATLLFDGESSHPFVEMLTQSGVRVHPIRLTPRAYARERTALRELFRAMQPQLVHTHGYRIDLLDRPVAAKLGIPTVTTIHGPSKMGGLKGAFFEWQQRRNYRRFDAVVAVSKSLHEEALAGGVSPNRLHVIPNAWSGLRAPLSRDLARRELGLDSTAAVVGWVGRFIHVKGADVFLEALRLLPEPRPIAAIIGYGPESGRIRQMIEDLALGHTVRLYSNIRDAGRYYPAFDTYVLSSRSEGLPIVLLEAMASNTPIVATRVGGVPEILSEREGWLVPSEDPAALSAALSASLRDRPAAADRARRSAERLKRDYSMDTFLKRYEEVYRGVLRPGDHGS